MTQRSHYSARTPAPFPALQFFTTTTVCLHQRALLLDKARYTLHNRNY